MAEDDNFKISAPCFDVDFRKHFLKPDVADMLYTKLEAILPHIKGRKGVLIGDAGLVYRINFRGKISERSVIPWDSVCTTKCFPDCIHSILPLLSTVKKYVDNVVGSTTTILAIQRYHDGYAGIMPHRDKEMVLGTRIAGLSLGATRTLLFERRGFESINLQLNSGSLYVMNPPTNSYWSHSIVKEPSVKTSRISLTFRNYADPE